MQELMDRAAEIERAASPEESMLWTEEEELLASIDLERLGSTRAASQQSREGVLRRVLRFAAMCAAVASTIAILAESIRSSASLWRPQDFKGTSSHAGHLPRWASAAGKSHLV